MIRVIKIHDGQHISLSGSPPEVMLFFGFWQHRLWPSWQTEAKFGKPDDHFTQMLKTAVENVKEGRPLLLQNDKPEFVMALEFALSRCELLGVEIYQGS